MKAMTVGQLVLALIRCDQDAEVVFGTDGGEASGLVREVTPLTDYGVGQNLKANVVRLECQAEYLDGEYCP